MKSPTRAEAESLALKGLGFLGSERERLEGFLRESGLGLEGLRAAAREPHFLVGVLDHFAADESLLLSFAAQADLDPARIAAARAVLAGPDQFDEP